MNYKEALEYLQELDTVPYRDTKFADAIDQAKDALQYCLDLGQAGENEESIRWEKASTTHVVLDPKTGECETTKELHHEQAH